MGLAVIHGIVKSYNGAITVDSTRGVGTCFEVFFPVAEKSVDRRDEKDEKTPMGKANILYVDDEDFLVELASQMLEKLENNVVATDNPQRALEIFKEDPYRFDLLITDMTMPHMSGIQLARAVRKVRKDFPVIICTGFSEQINGESAREMGLNGFLLKPFSIRDIAIAIRQALGKSDEGEENI
jgi:CheY-like chemotaxis protein